MPEQARNTASARASARTLPVPIDPHPRRRVPSLPLDARLVRGTGREIERMGEVVVVVVVGS